MASRFPFSAFRFSLFHSPFYTGCRPGFYYSLYSGTTVTNLTEDAEVENLGVLCGADGVVELPVVKKPSEAAGFYKVVTNVK